MFSAETQYDTHNGKLLAIVEMFKTWWHYLEGCKYEILVLTNYIKFCQFMNIKGLSSGQV